MNLSFNQKLDIIESFPELQKAIYKDGRVNYFFNGSKQRRKQIIRELSHTGNGYIYGNFAPELKGHVDDRGWISIKNCSEEELRELIVKVIESFR